MKQHELLIKLRERVAPQVNVQHVFRRLYARAEEGIDTNSIIAYGVVPYFRHVTPSDADFDEWTLLKRIIVVDLWVLKLRFTWVDRRFVPGDGVSN